MAPPPILQQSQQGTPGGGQQQQQLLQQQHAQTQQTQAPQGQLPSTQQISNRFPTGMGMGGGVGPGQQRPGTAGGPLGIMPSLGYPNTGVMNGTKVNMGGPPGVPGAQTGPIGNQVGSSL